MPLVCLDLQSPQLAPLKEELRFIEILALNYNPKSGEVEIITPKGTLIVTLLSGRYVEWQADDAAKFDVYSDG